MNETDRQIQELRQRLELAERERDLLRSRQASLRLELETLTGELEAIRGSRPYWIGLKAWDLRRKIAPTGSLRERVAGAIFDLIARRNQPQPAPAAPAPSASAPTAINDPRLVRIVAERFLDERGNNMFLGGAERYVVELARIVHELGYRVEVVQAGRAEWVRAYGDILVRALVCPEGSFRMGEVFHRAGSSAAALTIYHPFLLADQGAHRPAIGISHGIFWDQPAYQKTTAERDQNIHAVVAAAERLDRLISVDTNTVNWLRTMDARLAARVRYVPNFVDPAQFHPDPARLNNDRITILFPRRLYAPRGFWLVRGMIDEILERHPNAHFRFVGQADLAEDAEMQRLIDLYGERIRWECLPPEAMPEAYRAADITLIPTVNSEGTSLSCLEAQASGNAVIATNVGGLPDLVIHEYNGLLIEPRADQLAAALTRLIADAGLRKKLGRNAIESAGTFSLERWRGAWRAELEAILPRRARPCRPRPAILFPPAPGETWQNAPARRRTLATQLALFGWEVFWVNDAEAAGSPRPRLHILGRDDDLYLNAPIVMIDSRTGLEWLGRVQNPLLVLDAADGSDITTELATRAQVALASDATAARRINALGIQPIFEIDTDSVAADQPSRAMLPIVKHLLKKTGPPQQN